MSFKEKVLAFLREEEGLTTVEYAVAGALVATVLITAFINLRGQIIEEIDNIRTALDAQ
jgi:pilus assembly protein Flp/PilA